MILIDSGPLFGSLIPYNTVILHNINCIKIYIWIENIVFKYIFENNTRVCGHRMQLPTCSNVPFSCPGLPWAHGPCPETLEIWRCRWPLNCTVTRGKICWDCACATEHCRIYSRLVMMSVEGDSSLLIWLIIVIRWCSMTDKVTRKWIRSSS